MIWLLLIHLMVSAVCGAMLFTRRLALPRMMLAPVVLIPPAGLICLLLVWRKSAQKTGVGGREIGLEKLKVNNEMYQNVFYMRDESAKLTVPLEEALLLDDTKTKRALMMEVLNDDPEQYIELLQKARNDPDTEVSHYATTAMTELQKSYDLRMQQCEQAYAAAPADEAVLRQYLVCLKNYLNADLLDGALLAMYRNTYLQMLEKYDKLFEDSVRVLREIFEVQLSLNDISAAEDTVDQATKAWPEDAQSWLMRLQLEVTLKNSAGVRQTLKKLREKQLYIPERDRETVEFWENEEA